MRHSSTSGPGRACVLAGLTIAMAAGLSWPASAATKEIALANRDSALAYCQSGKMPSGDVDYILGAEAFAQYGPGSNCIQQAGAVDTFKKAIIDHGKRVGRAIWQTQRRRSLSAKAAPWVRMTRPISAQNRPVDRWTGEWLCDQGRGRAGQLRALQVVPQPGDHRGYIHYVLDLFAALCHLGVMLLLPLIPEPVPFDEVAEVLAEATRRVSGGPPAMIGASGRHLRRPWTLPGCAVVRDVPPGAQLTL